MSVGEESGAEEEAPAERPVRPEGSCGDGGEGGRESGARDEACGEARFEARLFCLRLSPAGARHAPGPRGHRRPVEGVAGQGRRRQRAVGAQGRGQALLQACGHGGGGSSVASGLALCCPAEPRRARRAARAAPLAFGRREVPREAPRDHLHRLVAPGRVPARSRRRGAFRARGATNFAPPCAPARVRRSGADHSGGAPGAPGAGAHEGRGVRVVVRGGAVEGQGALEEGEAAGRGEAAEEGRVAPGPPRGALACGAAGRGACVGGCGLSASRRRRARAEAGPRENRSKEWLGGRARGAREPPAAPPVPVLSLARAPPWVPPWWELRRARAMASDVSRGVMASSDPRDPLRRAGADRLGFGSGSRDE